ncbi:IS1478 transposase [Xanthomonas oryzae pv. oryzae KACC 10331]|uniref:IS1478 transposase n=1 Tax=Xanthomonas oryzae pv. oryzae (strain KACC10331 / KXO85) TaxID=291331 RepID=Q5H6M4_XANOR|nr:IS1478 transposase [Xanthomonas oryzae pv. oryzae KACC 10331]
MSRVIVDTTVQEKAIAHPTDSRLHGGGAQEAGAAGQAPRHRLAADLCEARSRGLSRKAGRYCACAPVQAHAQGTATPTHDPGTRITRSATQAGPAGTVGA